MKTFTYMLISLLLNTQSIEVSGIVQSREGTPVADATVVLTSGPLGSTFAAATDADGSWSLEGIPPGNYRLWVAMDGYSVFSLPMVLRDSTIPQPVMVQLQEQGQRLMMQLSASDREQFRQATQLLSEYKAEEALERFLSFIEKHPYLVRAYYNIGLCQVELAAADRDFNRGEQAMEHEKQARAYFSVVLQRYPDFSPALIARGESFVRTLDMEAAAQVWQRLLEVVPDDPRLYYTYGEILSWLKRLDDAEMAYREVLAVDPAFFDAHARIGAIHLVRKEYQQAIEQFELFLKYAPDSNMVPLTREMLEEAKAGLAEVK